MIYNKKTTLFFLFCFGLALVFNNNAYAKIKLDTKMSIPAERSYKDNSIALIILSTDTISELRNTIDTIKKFGGKIHHVFPNSVLFGKISPTLRDLLLKELPNVKSIEYSSVNLAAYAYASKDIKTALTVWNNSFVKRSPAINPGFNADEPFIESNKASSEAIRTNDGSTQAEANYKKHWQEKKNGLCVQFRCGDTKALPGNNIDSFGKTYGAGFYDTSLFFTGEIAVEIFFTKGGWTQNDKDTVLSTIETGLNQFILDEPNAHLTFFYINGGEDHDTDKNGDYTLANDLRNLYNTNWAYIIEVRNTTGNADAYLQGPSLRLYKDDLRDGYTPRHETMHIFGAMDQYKSFTSSCSPNMTSGYLSATNANCQASDGNGYFSGAGEGQDDIMLSGTGIINPIGVYTRQSIGWTDKDENGVFDVLDTYPDTTITSSKITNNELLISGHTEDQALGTQLVNDTLHHSVTVNTINEIQYRVNGLTWVSVPALDGNYDSAYEEFTINLLSLPSEIYTIEIRAINSQGNTEISYAKQTLTVDSNTSVTPAPFAAFSISPKTGNTGSNYTFDASMVTDLKDKPEDLTVRWDFGDHGTWSTDFSTSKIINHKFTESFLYTVTMQVKNSAGGISTATQDIFVAPDNQPPTISLSVTPEQVHGPQQNSFNISLDASKSFDDLDSLLELQAKFDFDNDGLWDLGPISITDPITHSYSLKDIQEPLFLGSKATTGYASGIFIVNNYAYIAAGSYGLQIYDISNTANSVLLGSYDTQATAKDVYVQNQIAYVADDTDGVYIIDVSNPSSPSLLSTYATPTYAWGVAVSGTTMYVADYNSLQIINVTDPHNPTFLGSYDGTTAAQSLVVSGNYIYLADGSSGLRIIDVSDPENPFRKGIYNTPGSANGVTLSGTTAYVADGGSGLQIINVSNPAKPNLLGTYDTDGTANRVAINGTTAFVADFNKGLKMLDVSNPSAVTQIARYNMSTIQDVFISENLVLATNGFAGFNIFDNQIQNLVADPSTYKWRIKMELTDSNGATSTATRDVWANTYNHPPTITDFKLSQDYTASSLGVITPSDASIIKIILQGKTLYILTRSNGLEIYNVSDPKNPILLNKYPLALYAKTFVLKNTTLYVLYYSSVQVIDVSNPSNPRDLGSISSSNSLTFDDLSTTDDKPWLYVSTHLITTQSTTYGFDIYDTSNPNSLPTLAGQFTASDPLYKTYFTHIFASGSYLYVTDQNFIAQHNLRIFNVDNPSSPIQLSSISLYNYVNELYVSGNIAYLLIAKDLLLIDVNNPSAPHSISTFTTTANCTSIFVNGTTAYLTSQNLKVIDVTNPSFPTLLSEIKAGAYGDAIADESNIYAVDASTGEITIYTLANIPSGFKIQNFGVQDPDSLKNWDGILQCQVDLENDNIWEFRTPDSKYRGLYGCTEVFSFDQIPDNDFTMTVEAVDRFKASGRLSKTFHKPIFNSEIIDQHILTNQNLSIDVQVSDADSDPLTLSATLDNGSALSTIGAQFTDHNNGTGTFNWTPTMNQVGIYSIKFQTSDGIFTATKTISIKVEKNPREIKFIDEGNRILR